MVRARNRGITMSLEKEKMDEDEGAFFTTESPGHILKNAREAKGMSIADVAEQTRVSIRQLEAVERDDFASLPGTPYAVGFSRAFARAVGADEVAVARGVRVSIGAAEPNARYEMFEPADPARVPPRWLAWIAATIAALLAIGYGVWRSQLSSAPTETELSDSSNATKAQVQPKERVAPPRILASATGPVVLTALDAVWLRIYDQSGTRLLEKQMAKGESYTVPATANNPMILTGRPDALSVTVGGRVVAPLGPPQKTVTDLPISAAALLAREASPVSPSAADQSSAMPRSPTPAAASAPESAPASAQARIAAPARPASAMAAAPAPSQSIAASTAEPAAVPQASPSH